MGEEHLILCSTKGKLTASLPFHVSLYKKANRPNPNKNPSPASIFVSSVCVFIPVQTSEIPAKLSQPTNPSHSSAGHSSKEEIHQVFKRSVI